MYAIVYEVDMKPDVDPATTAAELDQLAGMVKTLPGFVRATWTSDGTTGLSMHIYREEAQARRVAEHSTGPDFTAVGFRSVRVMEVALEVGT